MQGTAQHRALADATQEAIAPSASAPSLDAEEAHRILIEWNRTERGYDRTETVWGLIEKQAQRHPRRTAVIDGAAQIDYQRLTARADAIAGELVARGVTPGSLVGVCMGRTHELVATLLGVLRAGCAYVPLDPKYPRERVRYMLTHARAAAAIVDDEHSAALCTGAPQIVRLDSVKMTTPTQATMTGPSASDLAYVIYTSGSTGQPKGVAVEHRSVVAMTVAMRELLDDEALSGVLAAASVCFDPSVMEILGTLSLGGTVVLSENALTLPELPSAHRVRTVIMVPSAMQALLKAGGLPDGVRCVVLGGEILKPSLVKQLHARARPPRVVNVYGPTEDTVYSTATEVPAGAETITIGRPVPNGRVYILDEAMRPVPVGVPGELHLAGDKLARGYLHDEARSSQRFVAVDPDARASQGNIPEARLYRTGDRCRWAPDGEIEFLGRIDQQVKLRGFRIELEEIESTLESMHGVDSAAAAVVDVGSGKPMLIGYVAGDDAALSNDTLRAYVAERLPGYMVPQIVMRLADMPRLPNGKLDRKRLPAPASGAHDRTGEPPASHAEALPHRLAGLPGHQRREDLLSIVTGEIARFLRIRDPGQISPHQALEALGLDSLDSAELVHRLSTVLGRRLPASTLAEHQTPAAIADRLLELLESSDAADAAIHAPKNGAADTLARFQSQIQSGHPPFLAARAPAWSATDKGTLIREFKRLLTHAGRDPYSKLLRTGSGHRGTVVDAHSGEAREAIIWTTNLYLGLNRDSDVIAQARSALERFGTGMGTSATASGLTDLHLDFENEFAELVGKPAACLFPTGFTANLGVIGGLLGDQDLIVMDQLCHASIVDGARLCGATIRTFKHNDASDLQSILETEASPYRTTLVALEGVYSMGEGTAPVRDIVRTAKAYGALVLVDEAHSFGFYGARGAGICAAQGITDQVDFIMTTLSKALGSLGGVVAARDEHIALLKTSARAYVFQATTTPADIAAALAALRRLREDDTLRERLWDTTTYMRRRFTEAGYPLGTGDGPIVTPHFADSELLYAIARGLYARGIHTSAVTYPIVERGRGRLRFICSAAHTRDDVDRTLEALIDAEREAKQTRSASRDAASRDSGSDAAPSADTRDAHGMPVQGMPTRGKPSQRAGNDSTAAHPQRSSVEAWANAFADDLTGALARMPGPAPDLAVSIALPDDRAPISILIDGRDVAVGAVEATRTPFCSLLLTDDDAMSALRASDVQALLDSVIQGTCVLSGQTEPFIWLVGRLADRRCETMTP